ncbi:MAG: hypothetical protein ACXWXB_08970 [Actinomycetota bacterium]
MSVAGFDADPGTTNYVFTGGPGTMELMCWPFSEHGSGDAPDRLRLEIVDPLGLHVSGELPCEIESHTISDYFEAPIDEGPPPLDVARRSIEGLRPDDVLSRVSPSGSPASCCCWGHGLAPVHRGESPHTRPDCGPARCGGGSLLSEATSRIPRSHVV